MEKMKVTDELLEKVVPKLSDEMLDEYENSGDGEHKFSERFEKKMKRLIWQEKHKLHEIRTGAVIKMVAGLIAVLGVAFFFASMDSKADPRLLFEKMEVILEDSSLYVYDEELVIEAREYFAEGYHQAEKDLELSWEDMKLIWNITDELENMPEEEFYKEVLRRFKDYRERKEK